MTDVTPFAARVRAAMADARITTAAELERAWVARYGGSPASVHRQVMRLLHRTEHPQDGTAEKLASLTGKTPGYFTDGLRPPRRPRTADLQRRLEELVALVDGDGRALQDVRTAIAEHDSLLQGLTHAVEDLHAVLEGRLDQLEQRVRRLEP